MSKDFEKKKRVKFAHEKKSCKNKIVVKRKMLNDVHDKMSL